MAGLLPSYEMIDVGAIVLVAYIVIAMVTRIRTGALEFPHFGKSAVGRREGVIGQFASLFFVDISTSKPLRTCDQLKWASHILVFWGFVFDAIATVLDDLMNRAGATLPLDHPVKLFGNVGGIFLVVGCCVMFYSRFQESGSIWNINKADFFLLALLTTAATGFATESAIYSIGRSAMETAVVYWAHLVAIVSLFVTAPYTKFTHALYKPAWILHEKMSVQGRQQASWGSSVPELPPGPSTHGLRGNEESGRGGGS